MTFKENYKIHFFKRIGQLFQTKGKILFRLEFLAILLNWFIVSLLCCNSFRCPTKWSSYYSLLQDIDYSSLCYIVGACCLSTLYTWAFSGISICLLVITCPHAFKFPNLMFSFLFPFLFYLNLLNLYLFKVLLVFMTGGR